MTETMVQYSIFLGNKPGLLGKVVGALGAAKINIVALTMMDSTEHGVLRIVANDADKVRAALQPLNLSMDATRVLAVTMPNKPGALADVCEKLSTNRVQVSYLYSTTGAPGGKAIGIFKVQNVEKAAKVLEQHRVGVRDMKTKLRNHQRTGVAGRR